MTQLLSDLVAPVARFGRSTNIERDLDGTSLSGYLPTGRALDVVDRLARAMSDPTGGRALSITGPYGSGKSSLAVFVDALLGPASEPSYKRAIRLLTEVAPETASRLSQGRTTLRGHERGFIRAVTTAQQEPITATVLRALRHGLTRFYGRIPTPRQFPPVKLLSETDLGGAGMTRAREVRELAVAFAERAPLVLLIDEFGKNLEAFTSAGTTGEADLFLLQELAEAGHGNNRPPLFVVTLQHLAFDEYTETASEAQRREWVKVQGRFEDVPYVDAPAQTRTLIAAAFTQHGARASRQAFRRWADNHYRTASELGLPLEGPDTIAATYPLHPVTLLVLPELCSRYGQHERTLFSFLAGPEPTAVPAFLSETSWDKHALPMVGLDRVYDYFIESAATMVSAGTSASRWLEIETILRDTHGLTPAELQTAKTVAVLNLISTGGPLRASQPLLEWVLGSQATSTLRSLERRGLVTYREYADEFRLWRGSDFDLRHAVEDSRRQLAEASIAHLLNRVYPLPAAVAARHSTETGTLRVFQRRFVNRHETDLLPPGAADPYDGLVVYLLDEQIPEIPPLTERTKPIIVAVPSAFDHLRSVGLELAATLDVLARTPDLADDWVARRELTERAAGVRQTLDQALAATFDHGVTWGQVTPAGLQTVSAKGNLSMMLSQVCDETYPDTPRVPNEMLNRTALTSQGAKARRLLLEAMLTRPQEERLGIEGYGPERAMYEAFLRHTKIHRPSKDGHWQFAKPARTSGVAGAWRTIESWFRQARKRRINLRDLYQVLLEPPIGMRHGPIPVLVTAALIVHRDEIALYEHGTFRPTFTPDVAERIVANPNHFEIKYVAASHGGPGRVLERALIVLAGASSPTTGSIPGVLAIVSHLVRTVAALPDYTKTTTRLPDTTRSIRDALLTATEPDTLLFRTLPEALGLEPIQPSSAGVDRYMTALRDALDELTAAYPQLLEQITEAIRATTGTPTDDFRRHMASRASLLGESVLDPRLKAFLNALATTTLDDREWAEYVAMTITDVPPTNWTSDHVIQFEHRLHELAASFRRVEALAYERRARQGEPFDAVRITITHPTGSEHAEVVWIDQADKATVDEALTAILGQLRATLGDSNRARTALLAAVADRIAPTAKGQKVSLPTVRLRKQRQKAR